MAVILVGTGFALPAAVAPAPAPASAPAPLASPVDARDAAISRDQTRPELQTRVGGIQAQRRAELSKTSVEIGVQQRNLTVTEFVKQRSKAEKAARYADKVKKLGYDPKTSDPRDIAKQLMLSEYDWGADQFSCYDNIIMRESRWIVTADNPTSSAYGIPQALPGSKMASEGADWRTNPATQIKWGLKYVKDRYGTPCGAWGFKSANGWY